MPPSAPGETCMYTVACPYSDTPEQTARRRYYRPVSGAAPPRIRSRRGGSWAPTIRHPATTAVWAGRTRWLTAVATALAVPEGDRVRRTAASGSPVRRATVLAVARLDATTADGSTGRGVATAHATVARALGCTAKTVERSRLIIEALGFAVTDCRGRYLTRQERVEARARHGCHQTRMASQRRLVTPRSAVVGLPRSGTTSRTAYGPQGSPKRARRARKAAARNHPRPLALQRLAAHLIARMPWLGREQHPGTLCDALVRAGIDPDRWTAHDVLDLLDRHGRSIGWAYPAADAQASPIGLLVTRLRAALAAVPPDQDPAAVRARAAQVRAADRAAAAQDRARAAQVRVANVEPAAAAAIAAAKARIRAAIRR